LNSFDSRSTFTCGTREYTIYRLDALEKKYKVSRLPFSLRILLENLLRLENGRSVFAKDIEALASWNPKAEPSNEIAFTPARALLQDFTGVPCVVDLAAMRDAMKRLGGDPERINPLNPVELVIDHSVQVDAYGSAAALMINRDLEFERNEERYAFLKWGQNAFDNFKAVPPNMGIVHQVNLEFLARVVMHDEKTNETYPDTLVGTDSHTTMVNGLGVLGWGVGGIEAEAAMLGQPVSMLIPQVVGFRLKGELREGATATDLVLTVTEMLRKKGVVGKFVEFYGPGVSNLPVADRSTIGNMAPEYGATCGIFPVDDETLRYLRLTGRSKEQVELVETYMKEQGMFHTAKSPEPVFSDTLELDLSTVESSIAGPKRPQDRIRLKDAKNSYRQTFSHELTGPGGSGGTHSGSETDHRASAATTAVLERQADPEAVAAQVTHGSVVIAAITSCTNTSNPSVMVAAGLLASKALEKGLSSKPWVKTSLAPGSRVVTKYLDGAGLSDCLNQLGFNTVGYGCTTCIGNSGPLPDAISRVINEKNLTVCSVLSGNRNFEGRIQQDVKANYLMSPPLVVAYALAGTMDIDMYAEPLGHDPLGEPVFLKDIWPTQKEVAQVVEATLHSGMFKDNYETVFDGDEKWQAIKVTPSKVYDWPESTYIKHPPYFADMPMSAPDAVSNPGPMRCLAMLGDSVTTDHISPAGSIKQNSPAGTYLSSLGVPPHLFNSYGSRRGNHEVMMRGTFANVRLKNLLAPGTEGGFTTYLPTGEVTTIFEATDRYRQDGTPLLILAGKEYGSGSSRDWAAKGPALLGVRVVIADSYERIHRSNLVGMGVLPLQFAAGTNAQSLCLTGHEVFEVVGLTEAAAQGFASGKELSVRATAADGTANEFKVLVRIDTPQELLYYRHGGILQYVLRQLLLG
jgi:aconitate hydratase